MAALNEKIQVTDPSPFAAAPAPVPVSAPSNGGTDYYNAFTGVFAPVSAPLADTMERFHTWKENMGLIQPGTVENLTRPVSSESLVRIGSSGFRCHVFAGWPEDARNIATGALGPSWTENTHANTFAECFERDRQCRATSTSPWEGTVQPDGHDVFPFFPGVRRELTSQPPS